MCLNVSPRSAFRKVARATFVVLLAGALATAQSHQQEEMVDRYKKWLDEDVVYIITDQEREVFERLSSDDEKDHFIHQFWERRDQTPGDGLNEARQEHYRRLTYANEQFKSGIDGWATDRGRIYIRFGPPDNIERFPTGTRYVRPLDEGGGLTTTFPFEVWHYNYIEELGRELTIELVDPLSTGEYRVSLHDSEKDALLYVSGAGNTLGEDLGIESRAGRIRGMTHLRGIGLDGDSPLREGDRPFDLVEKYFELRRPPAFNFPRLRELVETRVGYDDIPVKVELHRQWLSADHAIAAVTLYVPTNQSETEENEPAAAQIELYGVVYTIAQEVSYEFEDQLVAHDWSSAEHLAYQKKIPLSPGRYKLTMVLRDRRRDQFATVVKLIDIPTLDSQLTMSDVVLVEQLVPSESATNVTEPFTTRTGFKVYPQRNEQVVSDRIAIFFEVYNFEQDLSTDKPDVTWAYGIAREDTPWEETVFTRESNMARYSNALAVIHYVPLTELSPGNYFLRIEVRDRVSGQISRKESPLTIAPEQVVERYR